MATARINGITLGFDDYGTGDPVVMVTGTGAPGRIWRTHQVPALTAAGHRVITVDNRGMPPSDLCPEGFTLRDMAADIAALIEHLGLAPCRVVGFSLGATLVQELLLARPELVRQAVLMAPTGRADGLVSAMTAAELDLCDSGVKLPPRYAAYVNALQNLSPETLNDETALRDWLDVFEMTAVDMSAFRGQLELQAMGDRLGAYRRISCPCLVIAFGDDLVIRPHLSREVAAAVPGCAYVEIPGCGHYGYLEKPDAVNAAVLDFFAAATAAATVPARAARPGPPPAGKHRPEPDC